MGEHFALTNWVSATISCPFVSLARSSFNPKDRSKLQRDRVSECVCDLCKCIEGNADSFFTM